MYHVGQMAYIQMIHADGNGLLGSKRGPPSLAMTHISVLPIYSSSDKREILDMEYRLNRDHGGPLNKEAYSRYVRNGWQTGLPEHFAKQLAGLMLPWWIQLPVALEEYVKNEHIIPMVETARKRRQQSLEYWLSEE
ncbi:MAG: hypothetical protein HONBIEJF_02873 [Fimbriimonadaceae bacterium]|nr:hypothetical protein [Fimbriimonadaceae bacterium]